ncbi:MAG: hypothetical protein R3Y38_07785 [Rikenellaceae bacterium]
MKKLPTPTELRKIVGDFNNKTALQHHRFASFDMCYNYFLRHKECLIDDMEKSCCVLWSYLGSWGMLRGSSFLLQDKNPSFFEDLIRYIQNDCQDVFDIDVDNYVDNGIIERIIEVYKKIYLLLGGDTTTPSSTLVTKIMLGVFGCITAFDQFFCETLGDLMPGTGIKSKIVSKNSLKAIYDFYKNDSLKGVIDEYSEKIKVANIFGADDLIFDYPKAKIIDMYGFNKGVIK